MAQSGNAVAPLLSECLSSGDSAKGRKRLKTYLESRPFPHYEAHPEIQGLLIRVAENGRRTVGRFVNRRFKSPQSSRKAATKYLMFKDRPTSAALAGPKHSVISTFFHYPPEP
jgi:hypothetical protein